MAIQINVKVAPFGEVVYRTTAPGAEFAEGTHFRPQEPGQYDVLKETTPRVLEFRYEREHDDYVVPSSTG